MRHLLSIAFCFFLLSCKETSSVYSIERVNKDLINSNDCKVASIYPAIHFKNDDSDMISLNENLEAMNEMDRFVKECSGFFPESFANKKKEIIGDYKVLFKTDTLLDIEYFVKFGEYPKIEYRNIFVNVAAHKLLEPEKALPNIDRSKLYPYVKRFVDSSGININLKAYEKDSNYAIMFGRSQEDFVLYLGKEGEFGGYYKITIPLKSVMSQ
jgi:hypothetical protein